MSALILLLLAVCLALLILEDRQVRRDRSELVHVVYVNGIRGKSTVTRMIDGGLRAGGWKVFCKTTGTVPMVIGVDGTARPLVRRGRANISEQVRVLHRAVREGAQILVIECMAVDPALQAVSQHRMVRADIGVITNVRLDHTAEMGPTLEEICDSLSNTIPWNGTLFTADGAFLDQLRTNGRRKNCRVELAQPDSGLPDFDFPENVALALPGDRGGPGSGAGRDPEVSAGPLCPVPIPPALWGGFCQRHVGERSTVHPAGLPPGGRPPRNGGPEAGAADQQPAGPGISDGAHDDGGPGAGARGDLADRCLPAGGAPHPAAHPAGHTCPAVSWSGGTALGQPGGGHYDICRWKLGRPG